MQSSVVVRDLGLIDYTHTWQAMQRFTDQRTDETCDEIWCLMHPAVFTQGQAGRAEHLLDAGGIAVVQTDRGGQITYHGPGQLVVYLLVDLRRKLMGVRALVDIIEASVVATLAQYQVTAAADPSAPGVYVAGRKIASLGLRVRKGCSFHGLALNVDMDLTPFERINPCGYAGLRMTQLSAETPSGQVSLADVQSRLLDQLCDRLVYNQRHFETHLPAG
jgi:lipoyl(octanoyl) transferase